MQLNTNKLTFHSKFSPSGNTVGVLYVKGENNRSFNNGFNFENLAKLVSKTNAKETAYRVSDQGVVPETGNLSDLMKYWESEQTPPLE